MRKVKTTVIATPYFPLEPAQPEGLRPIASLPGVSERERWNRRRAAESAYRDCFRIQTLEKAVSMVNVFADYHYLVKPSQTDPSLTTIMSVGLESLQKELAFDKFSLCGGPILILLEQKLTVFLARGSVSSYLPQRHNTLGGCTIMKHFVYDIMHGILQHVSRIAG